MNYVAWAIAAAVGFGSAWQWQSYRIDGIRLEHANEQLSRERDSRAALADAQAKVTAAQAGAKAATDRIRRDAAGAANSGNGLRDALANAVRTASTDLQACTRQVDAISELFTASTTAYRELAAEVDEWSTQAVILQDAWPGK